MKFTVLGIGKTGQTMAAYLLNLGHEVVLWDRDEKKAQIICSQGITSTGLLEGEFYPTATASIEAAVSDAQYIFVMTVAAGHKPVAELLSGNLKQNQRIVIFNGNWGAVEFDSVLHQELLSKKVLLSETGGMIFLADSAHTGTCHLRKIKNTMSLAGIPASCVNTIAEELLPIFPQFVPAANVLETSINNANPILHVTVSLFNISRIENAESYRFYDQAASRLVLSYAEKADAERVAIAQAMGIRGESCLDILNSFWTIQHDNLYDVIKKNDNYLRSIGPVSLDYRYLTEDLPYGIVPLVTLGHRYGIDIPYLSMLAESFSLLLEKNLMQQGPDLKNLELERLFQQKSCV